jgi:hypothetical protein
MNLRVLECVIAVAEHGSVNRAAPVSEAGAPRRSTKLAPPPKRTLVFN